MAYYHINSIQFFSSYIRADADGHGAGGDWVFDGHQQGGHPAQIPPFQPPIVEHGEGDGQHPNSSPPKDEENQRMEEIILATLKLQGQINSSTTTSRAAAFAGGVAVGVAGAGLLTAMVAPDAFKEVISTVKGIASGRIFFLL